MVDLALQFTVYIMIPLFGLLAICFILEIILPKDEAFRMKFVIVCGIIVLIIALIGQGSGL